MNEELVNEESLPMEPGPAPSVEGLVPETAPSVEVISVDELMERLLAGSEEDGAPAEETPEPSPAPEPEPLEVAGTDETLQLLETIRQDVEPHPFLTTDFEDYTVAEGLLLLALLLFFISVCIKMLKEGFSWL